jgi:hypothetical protein
MITGNERITSAAAQDIAAGFLIDHVGELLVPGEPELLPDGNWRLPVFLSTSRRGTVGQVGFITVDARTGEVLFPDEELARVKASARLLVGTSSP